MSGGKPPRGRARTRARRLAMQALYQWQMTGQEPAEIHAQFCGHEDLAGVDEEYFSLLLLETAARRTELDARIAQHADRAIEHLDPVEHAILLIGVFELARRTDVPYRVVINEAVDLTKRFGAAEGHRYVNALLDRVARDLRPEERQAAPIPTRGAR